VDRSSSCGSVLDKSAFIRIARQRGFRSHDVKQLSFDECSITPKLHNHGLRLEIARFWRLVNGMPLVKVRGSQSLLQVTEN
jgi:hypothetical protein